MQARKEMARFTRFPAISQAAEYQVMGYLVRRNILTYKAPPTNEGYDLICIHPDPRKASRQILTRGLAKYVKLYREALAPIPCGRVAPQSCLVDSLSP